MTKENIWKILYCIVRTVMGILGAVLFLLAPTASYVAFETITGNVQNISPWLASLNIMWITVMYLAALGLCSSTRIAVPLVSFGLFFWSLAEYFVMSFRGTPIMVWDILSVGTAMTVAGNYVFEATDTMRQIWYGLLAANGVMWLFPVRVKNWRQRLFLGAGCAVAVVSSVMQFYGHTVPDNGMQLNMWAMNDTYDRCGYLLSTALSLKYIGKNPPMGYSQAELGRLYERLAEEMAGQEKEGQESIQPVNLICIMNESFSELKTSGDFPTSQEYLPFISRLKKNTVRGSLCVPVFGSFTSNTEFEFLTGDSMALLPPAVVAYQFYVNPGTSSLVSTLKDQGYHTVAMHPYPAENWKRDECYPNMGFDEFLAGDYYKGCETFRNYVSDRADYGKLIEVVEQKEDPEDRMFIFNVTMQNHGGYEGTYENFEEEVWLTGEYKGRYPKTDQYLSLIKRSDEAFEGLLEYFEGCGEPTMIVMFGDHQPSVEDEFFDEIYGMSSADVPVSQRIMWYETPFVIWTNYEQPDQDMGRLSAFYLSSHVLSLAGLEMTPYNWFLLQMSGKLPVIHPIGCYGEDGTFYGWEEAETVSCPYNSLLLDYERLVYNHSMDGKGKERRELFTLP